MLFEIQQWMGAMIAQPLQTNHLLPETTPFDTPTKEETEKYIAPSRTLYPHQRIQIYHQQYWWRLLKCLQTNFPTLVRLFGKAAFEQKFCVPYLTQCPPKHWALCRLGETFPGWLGQHYQASDHYLVTKAAEIDWAINEAFWVGELPKVDFSMLSSEEQLAIPMQLQTHIHLFACEGDFFSFREEFLQHDYEYYSSNPFPEMVYGDHHFVVYRSPANQVSWKKISSSEFWLLSQFRKGCTIEKACACLEEEGGELLEEALSQMPFWFKQWTVCEWFGQLSS